MTDYSKIQIGDKAELKHRITQHDIDAFVDMTGDSNKLHVNGEYAARTAFKKPVVHGMLGASFISTIIGTRLPGDGALWFSQKLDFLLPVRVGDEITVKAEVIKKNDRDRVLELRTDIFNQHQQKVTAGTALVKVIEEETREPEKPLPARKVALVVGGTGGIGREASLRLARDGFDIIIHYHRNEEAATELKKEIKKAGRRCLTVKADITDEPQVQEIKKEIERSFGELTVLANCATIKIASTKFPLLQWRDLQNHIDINIKGAFHLVQQMLTLMERQKYGKIIHITTQAIETPNAEWLHYITAKAALHGFSKALAVELAPRGIRVNMISPGMTDTELISEIPEKIRLLVEARTPLKRLASPGDIAEAICFLASEKADFLTGETIRINGGQVMI